MYIHHKVGDRAGRAKMLDHILSDCFDKKNTNDAF